MATKSDTNWECIVSANLKGCSADQVWPLLEDFFNIHKWLPTIVDACYGIKGVSGEPGCVRYCANTSPISVAGSGLVETKTLWAHEKLLAIDSGDKWLSYEFMDNNVGYTNNVATIKVLPLEDTKGEGCQIRWSMKTKPMEGWCLERLVSVYEYAIQTMAKTMEEYLSTPNHTR